MRDTKQRQAIAKVVASDINRLWSPKELCEAAAKDVPNIGIATVYRNIRTMLDENRLMAVAMPGLPDRYCAPDRLNAPTRIQIATDTGRAWAFWPGDSTDKLGHAQRHSLTIEYGKKATNG